jgi:hypothetical protein
MGFQGEEKTISTIKKNISVDRIPFLGIIEK